MNKKLLIMLFFLVMFIGFYKVSALDTGFSYEIRLLDDCDALLGDPAVVGKPAYYLQTILDVMKYAGIVLLIVLSVVDFFKVLVNDDKDAVKPLVQKTIKRVIFAVLLFFLPILANILLSLVGVYGTCGIS